MNGVQPILVDAALHQALSSTASSADAIPQWPSSPWQRLREAGVLAWSIPRDHGGQALSATHLLAGYEPLAGACLTTAFILSQREAAVRRLIASANVALARRFLPGLARGELFATVGLSQLTTSRQHQAPALTVSETPTGFRLDGLTPWVTGAEQSDLIVIGATLADGRQLLLGLPRGQEGVAIEPPLPLMALAGSVTCTLRLKDVALDRDWLIAGPAEKIMAGKPGGVGGLETSCLALGLAGAAVDYVCQEAERRSDLSPAANRLQQVRERLRTRLHDLADATPTQEDLVAVRVECTQFTLQATQVAMTTAKGAGFVSPHPVQRWARQALFFLVLSCPRPAAEGLIGQLLPA
ncbi:MAG TPA: acyl-CoA dehydrogenase family protein [Gemmataceae bacterium]|nr:acyl-CoA dehydrogenase family protein [Gemmataceae bacterium]